MAKHSFTYSEYKVRPTSAYPLGQTVYRPFVTATVTAQTGRRSRIFALVDSGADACIFPLKLALILKLDVQSMPSAMTGGIGDAVHITYYDTLTVDLGSGLACSVHAGFTEGMNGPGIGLLGQDGFFSAFDITFSRSARTFSIEAPEVS